MKLYTFFRSSAAFRMRIALNLKGLAYEPTFINLRKGEQRAPDYLTLNPEGLVPLLVSDGLSLSQSLAMMEYLEETYPKPPFLPSTPAERARVRSLAQVVACDIHPINNARVLRYLTDVLKVNDAGIADWYRHWVDLGLDSLEVRLSREPETGRFCHGQHPSMADICLIPQIFNAMRYDKDPLTRRPTLKRIFEACMALDAFDKAQPERQPDLIP
ncbi:MAG TPA: maleylacetoacetate isomerase [Alphaproteobacteria bacterium]|nr:maleylacetoacetate isomerase [Alphaproteobacteria bacterium]